MVTLGTDPEFFLLNAKTQQPVAVCGKLGGTKGDALDIGGGYGVQEDNVMVEWNTPPMNDPYDFARCVVDGYHAVVAHVNTKIKGVVPSNMSFMDFPGSELVSKQAQEFGCSQDYDAYERGAACHQIDPVTLKTKNGGMRFAGGHMHIGYDNPNSIPDFVIASFADVYLGLYAIMLGEQQGPRRQLYGTAGRYRPTAYGIEYRTMSNFWTWNGDHAVSLGERAYNLGRMIETTDLPEIQRKFKEVPWADVRRAIGGEDRRLADQLVTFCRRDLGL